jgi:hypothetical protein
MTTSMTELTMIVPVAFNESSFISLVQIIDYNLFGHMTADLPSIETHLAVHNLLSIT